MKVLFVLSGNSRFHQKMPAFIQTQADSLVEAGIELGFYQIHGRGVLGYLNNIHPLRNQLKTQQWDVIHAHYGFCGVVAALARRKEKLVVSFMGETELLPDPDDKYNPFLRTMLLLHRVFARYVFDFIIFKSENLARILKGVSHKMNIVPNGVNLNVFKPIDQQQAREFLNLDFKQKIILWIGSPGRKVKGYALAVETVERVKHNYQDVCLLSINNVANHLLPYYYNAADVFLLSSSSEGSPNVVKEAMACNCPVVATDVGDVAWLLNDTSVGAIAHSFDPDVLGNLILAYLNQDQRSNGYNRICELGLEASAIAQRLLAIYHQLT